MKPGLYRCLLAFCTLPFGLSAQPALTITAAPGRVEALAAQPTALPGWLLARFWGVRREFTFQVRWPDGRPFSRRIEVELRVENLGLAEVPVVQSRSVITDAHGRFRGVYGGGALREPAPGSPPFSERQRHVFLIGGRVAAVFLMEVEQGGVRLVPEGVVGALHEITVPTGFAGAPFRDYKP